ncbi:MAG: flavin reductase family protein [Gemmataceae bacterium]|nr:flavin reductase family protein [Gemmataceae bacterium]
MKPDDPDKHLAAALGKVPSGIFVLTIAQNGMETGMLGSWVQQCSFEPPLITMAIRRDREISALFGKGQNITLNILEEGQTDMIVHFGKGFGLNEEAFNGLEILRGGPGGPVLAEALAVLECQIVDRFAAGDHDLFLGKVMSGRLLDEGHPMVHVRKNGFHY